MSASDPGVLCAFCGYPLEDHEEHESKIIGGELHVKCVLQPDGYAIQQSVSLGPQNDNAKDSTS